MPEIIHEIYVEAPIHVCFDLTRDVRIHIETTMKTKEKAVGGVTSGLMEAGDSVTWEAGHLGVKQRLTAKITEMEKPYYFKNVLVKGAFKSCHLLIPMNLKNKEQARSCGTALSIHLRLDL